MTLRSVEGPCPDREELARDLLTGRDRHAEHCRGCTDCGPERRRLTRLLEAMPELLEQPATEGCPGIEDWIDLLAAPRMAPRVPEGVDHLVTCDRCAALWSYLCEVDEIEAGAEDRHAADPDRGPPVDEPGVPACLSRVPAVPPGRNEGPPAWAQSVGRAVAAVVVVAFAVLWLWRPPPPVGTGGAERLRGPLPAMTAELEWEGERPIFRWVPVEGARSYVVRAWRVDGTLLATATLSAGVSSWGPEGSELATASQFHWIVEAADESRVIATSGLRDEAVPDGGPGTRDDR